LGSFWRGTARLYRSSCTRDAKTCEDACGQLESGRRLCAWRNPDQRGKGTGHSVIEPGPGEASLIEDFISSSPAAHWHSLIWWEKAGKVFRKVSCDDFSEEACTIENGRGRWEGNEIVWQLTVPQDGKDVPAKIVWAEKDNGSFAENRYVADASGTLKRDWTFLHTRVK